MSSSRRLPSAAHLAPVEANQGVVTVEHPCLCPAEAITLEVVHGRGEQARSVTAAPMVGVDDQRHQLAVEKCPTVEVTRWPSSGDTDHRRLERNEDAMSRAGRSYG